MALLYSYMVATIPIAKDNIMTTTNKAYTFTLTDCNGEQWMFHSDTLWTVGCYGSSNHCGIIQDAYSDAWAKSRWSGKVEQYSLVVIHNYTGNCVHDAIQKVMYTP